MNANVAIILAAGRGSRMGDLTIDRPKCLTPLAGRPLLHWQIESLRQGGAGKVLLVRGYQAQMLAPSAVGLPDDAYDTLENPRWAETNMLSTLLCAAPWLEARFAAGAEQVVISYSDIVYRADHVAALLQAPHALAITYDTMWEPLWRLRFGDPLLDAETFRQQDGLLREIGGKPKTIAEVCGQYMGLIKCTAAGWAGLTAACQELGDAVRRTDMTSFLRHLLGQGTAVGAVPVAGGWCETDSAEDLAKYEATLQTEGEGWSHDWRQPR